jgi:hypothetical protein
MLNLFHFALVSIGPPNSVRRRSSKYQERANEDQYRSSARTVLRCTRANHLEGRWAAGPTSLHGRCNDRLRTIHPRSRAGRDLPDLQSQSDLGDVPHGANALRPANGIANQVDHRPLSSHVRSRAYAISEVNSAMHKNFEFCRVAESDPHTRIGCLSRSTRMQRILATMACLAGGIAITATTAESLTQISAWALPTSPIDQASPPTIDTAFATLRPASIDTVPVDDPVVNDRCKDFIFSFLNSACSKNHKRHAARRIHRVATFVIGNRDATP